MLPQGINFRATSGYVTDGANEDYEILDGSTPNYPHTTAQGNNVGWETIVSNVRGRDRSSGNDRRLAGMCFNDGGDVTYRIDLPSSGDYNVGIAAGDAFYASNVVWDLFDTSSSLGSLTTGTTSAAQRFKDATNTEYTEATWPSSQALASKTFATTILRISNGASPLQVMAHFYVESAGGGEPAPGNGFLGLMGVGR